MASQLYEFLSGIGYHHPLHPALTHLPVGLTIAAFIFIALAFFLKRPFFSQTAKHCVVLAILATIPTIIFGYLDWQHFYGGAFLFPIKMKIGLAAALVIFLISVAITGKRSEDATASRLMVHLLCLLLVAGLGYFGGELVYGKKTTSPQAASKDAGNSESVMAGAKIFETSCSFCHFTDNTDTKVGPGLKGLFQKEKMPVSGWIVSPENIERQLKTPFEQMPPFDQLSMEEINALTEYLKTL